MDPNTQLRATSAQMKPLAHQVRLLVDRTRKAESQLLSLQTDKKKAAGDFEELKNDNLNLGKVIQQMRTEHDAKLSQMRTEHDAKLSLMRTEHDAKLSQMRTEHDAKLSVVTKDLETVRRENAALKANAEDTQSKLQMISAERDDLHEKRLLSDDKLRKSEEEKIALVTLAAALKQQVEHLSSQMKELEQAWQIVSDMDSGEASQAAALDIMGSLTP